MNELPSFSYRRPDNIEEAVAALAAPGARAYAGGTDLLPAMAGNKSQTNATTELVDVKHLPEIRGIERSGERIRIGACTTAADLAASDLVARYAPALALAAAITSAPALRRRGTVGGNIVSAHPTGDVATALLAMDASTLAIDADGEREVSLDVAMRAPWPQARLLCAVTFPAHERGAYERVATRTAFGRTLVSVALARLPGGLRIALGGMGERPLLAPRTTAAIEKGAVLSEALAADCRPTDDPFATAAERLTAAAALLAVAAEGSR